MIHFKRENKIIPVVEGAVTTQYDWSVSRSKNPAVLLLTCSFYVSGCNNKTKINKLVQI